VLALHQHGEHHIYFVLRDDHLKAICKEMV